MAKELMLINMIFMILNIPIMLIANGKRPPASFLGIPYSRGNC